VINQTRVEVITTEVCITAGRFDFKNTVAELQNGDIECSATEVINGDCLILILLIETISQRSGRRLVNNTFYSKTGNFACFLRSFTLRIVKVGRHCNDRFRNFFAEIFLSSLLHLLKHHSRYFLRRVRAVFNLYTSCVVIALHNFVRSLFSLFFHLIMETSHESLNRRNCLFRIRNSLSFCRCTNQAFAIFGKSHNRWGCTAAF